jgi:predicted  nucleic acid-binding Zn-ribbon protein
MVITSFHSYVKEKGARQLQQCEENVLEHETRIKDLNLQIEELRTTIAEIDKEINESGASLANLRENIRIRKLAHDIEVTKAEINSYDLEEAARARRNFEDKYSGEKEKESQMQTKVKRMIFVTSFGRTFTGLVYFSILTLEEKSAPINPSSRHGRVI